MMLRFILFDLIDLFELPNDLLTPKNCRVVVVDAQTFLIPNFTYDGQAPDAHFWVGEGSRPGPEVSLGTDKNIVK